MPVEERRFKEMMEQQFGEKGATQAKICSHIMTETGTVFSLLATPTVHIKKLTYSPVPVDVLEGSQK